MTNIVFSGLWTFLSSQAFANTILLISAVLAFSVAYRQIVLNDVVELYAFVSVKETRSQSGELLNSVPSIFLQNIGTRLVYIDKYSFNGKIYQLDGQVLPPASSQAANGIYWIELPTNGENHVSLEIYYHDIDKRKWKTLIYTDLNNGIWNVRSLPKITAELSSQ